VRTDYENRNRNFNFFKKKELDENPKSSFRVLNKFGSLVPLILLLTWGCCYCLLSFFFSRGGCYSSPLASVLFLGEISPTGDPQKKKSSATSIKDFFLKKFSKHSPYFLEKQ